MHWLAKAEASYAADASQFSLVSQLPLGNIVACELLPDIVTHRPAYVLALDPARRAVVVAVRGTADPLDLITDLCVCPVGFHTGLAHEGIARAAGLVLEEVDPPPCPLFFISG